MKYRLTGSPEALARLKTNLSHRGGEPGARGTESDETSLVVGVHPLDRYRLFKLAVLAGIEEEPRPVVDEVSGEASTLTKRLCKKTLSYLEMTRLTTKTAETVIELALYGAHGAASRAKFKNNGKSPETLAALRRWFAGKHLEYADPDRGAAHAEDKALLRIVQTIGDVKLISLAMNRAPCGVCAANLIKVSQHLNVPMRIKASTITKDGQAGVAALKGAGIPFRIWTEEQRDRAGAKTRKWEGTKNPSSFAIVKKLTNRKKSRTASTQERGESAVSTALEKEQKQIAFAEKYFSEVAAPWGEDFSHANMIARGRAGVEEVEEELEEKEPAPARAPGGGRKRKAVSQVREEKKERKKQKRAPDEGKAAAAVKKEKEKKRASHNGQAAAEVRGKKGTGGEKKRKRDVGQTGDKRSGKRVRTTTTPNEEK